MVQVVYFVATADNSILIFVFLTLRVSLFECNQFCIFSRSLFNLNSNVIGSGEDVVRLVSSGKEVYRNEKCT